MSFRSVLSLQYDSDGSNQLYLLCKNEFSKPVNILSNTQALNEFAKLPIRWWYRKWNYIEAARHLSNLDRYMHFVWL